MSGLKKTGLTALVAMVAMVATLALHEARAAEPAASAPGPAVAPLPPCWPSNLGGTGTALQSFSNRNGQAFGWWCKDATTGAVSRQGFHADRGYAFKWPATMTGSLPEMAAAVWRANVLEQSKNTPEIYALRAALYQEMWATRPEPAPVTPPPPPPKQWRVMTIESVGVPPPNAKVSTLQNGALTPVPPATKTVPWGTLCDCSAGKFIAADQAYCPWVGQTQYVARCQRQ